MKKKIIIAAIIALIICIIAVIYIPRYKIDRTFTYEIDKEKGEVTITGYLGEDIAWERFKRGKDKQLNFPEKIVVPKKIKGYPVTTIGSSAFEWAKAKEIILPDTVACIEDRAFGHCSNLEILKGTDNVETIGFYAFGDTEKLQELYMPKLREIEEQITILGVKGSYAEQYALEEGLKFREVGQ